MLTTNLLRNLSFITVKVLFVYLLHWKQISIKTWSLLTSLKVHLRQDINGVFTVGIWFVKVCLLLFSFWFLFQCQWKTELSLMNDWKLPKYLILFEIFNFFGKFYFKKVYLIWCFLTFFKDSSDPLLFQHWTDWILCWSSIIMELGIDTGWTWSIWRF